MRGVKYMTETLDFTSLFNQEDGTLTINSIFGQNDEAYSNRKRVFDYSELLKTVNYVTIQNHRKNATNVFKRYQANDLCKSALKETANYNFEKPNHKVDLKK